MFNKLVLISNSRKCSAFSSLNEGESRYFSRPTHCLPTYNPVKTAINPSALLSTMLSRANLASPFRKRALVSSAKEEKVVNPPNNPVKRKALVWAEK